MTIDEAIKKLLDEAKQQDKWADNYVRMDYYSEATPPEVCRQHAKECRQLAEWLIELKKAKRFIREIENKLYLGTSFYPTSFLKENEKLFDELTKGVEYLDD